jgi:hypothetical protein
MAKYYVQFIDKDDDAVGLYVVDDAADLLEAVQEVVDLANIPANAIRMEIELTND